MTRDDKRFSIKMIIYHMGLIFGQKFLRGFIFGCLSIPIMNLTSKTSTSDKNKGLKSMRNHVEYIGLGWFAVADDSVTQGSLIVTHYAPL